MRLFRNNTAPDKNKPTKLILLVVKNLFPQHSPPLNEKAILQLHKYST
jgi:hypothetical protein